MKKFLQILGCLSLVFLFSCSDDDPTPVAKPDYVYRPFEIAATNSKDAVAVSYALADHKGLNEVCYTDMTVSLNGGEFAMKPYQYALFCNANSYCTIMPSIPYYTLASVDKVITKAEGTEVQSVPVVGGQCENAGIKIMKGENNSFVLTMPVLDENAAKPEYRLTFSCDYGTDSPFNNVKAIVYVNRAVN